MPTRYDGRGKPRPYGEENMKKEYFRAYLTDGASPVPTEKRT